jgi:uroporphyrinogen-III synthase
MSLSGTTIAVTGSRRANELSHIIRAFGGNPYIVPTIGIEITEQLGEQGKEFILEILKDEFDYVVLMTGPSVFSIMNIAERLGIQEQFISILNRTSIVCRSEKPAAALHRFRVKVDLIPPDENTAEGILKLLLKRNLQNKKIAVLWHGYYSGELSDQLQRNGAKVSESFTYRYSEKLDAAGSDILEKMGFKYEIPVERNVIRLIEDVSKGTTDAVTFTSPPSARELFRIASKNKLDLLLRNGLNNKTIVVAIGPSTKKILEENKVLVDIMPTLYKMGPMISALSEFIQHKAK